MLIYIQTGGHAMVTVLLGAFGVVLFAALAVVLFFIYRYYRSV